MKHEPLRLDYMYESRLTRSLMMLRDRSSAVRMMMSALHYLGWRFAAAGVLALLVAAFWFGLSPGLGVLAGIGWFILLPALAGMMMQVRRRRANVILSYVEQAVRLNLPLPGMLDAAAQSERRRTATRLRRLRDLLQDGAPLEGALRVAAPEVNPRLASLIGAGERLGTLPQMLARAIADPRDGAEAELPSRDAFTRWYPPLMAMAVLMMVTLLMVFVVPKMEEIFRDFGMRLPQSTRVLVRLARTFDDFLLPIAAVLIVLSVMGGAFRRVVSGRGELERTAPVDHFLWRLPIAHGLERDRGLADACYTIADGLRTGRSLPRAIGEAAQLRINLVLRQRLVQWQGRIESGEGADAAARRAKLPPLIGGMIGSGKGGDPAQAVEFLAAYYSARFSRSHELLRAASVPLLVFFFASIVLLVASGMYLPLIQMIDVLSAKAVEVSK